MEETTITTHHQTQQQMDYVHTHPNPTVSFKQTHMQIHENVMCHTYRNQNTEVDKHITFTYKITTHTKITFPSTQTQELIQPQRSLRM